MTKEVLVTIRGMQFTKQEEGDLEPIEVIMAGDYYKIGRASCRETV